MLEPESACWLARRGLPCGCHLCVEGGGEMALLDLPDIRQDGPHDCGEAAARCALGFLRVVAPARFACEIDGADPRAVESYFRRIGLRVQSGEMTADDLRHHAGEGRPVLLLVHWPGEAASHWVACRGVSRGRVYYQDPAEGRRACPLADFLAAWKADDGRMSRPFRGWGVACWVP